MPRRRVVKSRTTVTVDREVLEALKKLRRYSGEPLNEVIKRLIKNYATAVGI
jgi:predicted CopG family antitoxin